MKNYWVIGDLHGEITLLDRLLDNIRRFNPEGLVFVGDYIDRGPGSKAVIDRIRGLPEQVTCIMGNHELMMMNALEDMGKGGSPIELWYYNGGEATLQSFGYTSFFSFESEMEAKYLDFFQSLSLSHIIETEPGIKILVTHAGISPSIPLSDQLRLRNYRELNAYLIEKQIDQGDSFLWIREAFFDSNPALWEGFLVVHGHTPVLKLKRFISSNSFSDFLFIDNDLCIRKDSISGKFESMDIDSGSVISGRLSGVGFFEEEDDAGKPVLRMRSLTVSREDIIPRDLGIVDIAGR